MLERFGVGLDEFGRSLPASAESRANCKSRPGLRGSLSPSLSSIVEEYVFVSF